jgi:hypothetical protein
VQIRLQDLWASPATQWKHTKHRSFAWNILRCGIIGDNAGKETAQQRVGSAAQLQPCSLTDEPRRISSARTKETIPTTPPTMTSPAACRACYGTDPAPTDHRKPSRYDGAQIRQEGARPTSPVDTSQDNFVGLTISERELPTSSPLILTARRLDRRRPARLRRPVRPLVACAHQSHCRSRRPAQSYLRTTTL